MNKLKLSATVILASFSVNCFSIVDYTDTVSTSETKVKNSRVESRAENSGSRISSGDDFSLSLNSEFLHQSMSNNGKFNKTLIGLNIETPVNFWFNGHFWQGSGSEFTNADLNKSHKGNPELKLGFNFLQVGSRADMATMDIYGGTELSSSSKLASSRTDQIYGLDLSKRFYDFALGLGFELRTTGKAKNSADYDLGNIQRIKGTFGWMVSNDIQFQTEFVTTSVGEGEGQNRLPTKIQYSSLSPRLILTLARFVNFTLGADFLVQRPAKEIDTLALKLNTYAPTGTTLVAGLGLGF